jgi:hypothetical protein
MVWERSDLRAMCTRVLEMLDGIGVLAGCLELFCIAARGRAERAASCALEWHGEAVPAGFSSAGKHV